MGKKDVNVNVNVNMVIYNVPYKKRKISTELNKFCTECDEKLSQLSKVIRGHSPYPPHTEVGYWLEGDVIDRERRIYIERTGKYGLHVDWSKCDKKLIEDGARYYFHDGKWHTLPKYIKALFVDECFAGIDQPPTYKLLEDGCIVSFSKWKCRDAIYWDHLPDHITMDRKGAYESIGMSDIASELLHFADYVMNLEMSMNTKTCMGLWNLPFLDLEKSDICGRDAKHRVDKGYYLCEHCGQMYHEMFGRIRKIR